VKAHPLRLCNLRQRAVSVALAMLAWLLAGAASAEGDNIADIPFEQLLQTDIISASRIARQISDAPSAVSVVTAEDIKTFGYRSLTDILDNMRGLFMAHNRAYAYVSGRGYGNPGANGDAGYAGRLTLLIDGYRAQENLYGQVFLGNDGLLDVDLIERVEYIPGSGSSGYGDSAFLGVINVITKKGQDINGTQVRTEFGSHGWQQNRVIFGRQFESGLDLVLSASGMKSDGRDLPSDVVGDGWGKAENDHNQRYFIKALYGGWSFESSWAERVAPMSEQRVTDTNSFANLKYDGDLGSNLKSSTSLYYGNYRFNQYKPDSTFIRSGGSWRGVDSKLVGTWFDRHTLVFGAEYRDDFQQSYQDKYFDEAGDAATYRIDANRRTTSVYFYDDIALTNKLQLNLGARRDSRNDHGATFSPRAAAIYTPISGTTLKLSTGQAHRQQTPMVEDGLVNPVGERATTSELVWEQALGRKTRLIGSLYRYRIDNYYRNWEDAYDGTGNWIGFNGIYGSQFTKGVEVELEHLWDNGVRLRSSYAHQDTHDENGQVPTNTPRHIAKLNLSVPLAGESLRAGLGIRYLGRRLDQLREYQPGVLIADLTLTGKLNNWSASFSVRNLGNTRYNEVSGALIDDRGIYPADRRNVWLQLGYDFK
jgi:outer membrane receptor for ferrienterochelin and colicin